MLPPRQLDESERAARARAEVDPETRYRITWAHEHVEAAHGIQGLRSAPALSMSRSEVRRSGLTLGEAEAAGLKVER
jgi:hypothetical protein